MPRLEVPGGHINYLMLERAAARPAREAIVFVHGMASSLAFWNLKLTQNLADYYSVFVVDLRGHGRSSIPDKGYRPGDLAGDITRLLDHHSIPSAHIIAHSFGGCVALKVADQHPKVVSSLTIIDTRLRSIQPTIDFSKWSYWPVYKKSLEDAGVIGFEAAGELGAAMFTEMAKLRLENSDQFERLSGAMIIPFAGIGGANSARRWLKLIDETSFLEEYKAEDALEESLLGRLDVPTLLLYGEYSQALPSAEALAEKLATATLCIVEKAGHFFPLVRPDTVNGAVFEFLEQCSARQQAAAY
ncbi:MAG: alpha/beta hydrolase [Pseudomonadota bacterium]